MTQNTKNTLLTIASLILLLAIAAFALKMQKPIVRNDTPVPPTQDIQPARTTVKGTYVTCLPLHDNFSAKQCIAGIKGDDGTYYALDFNLMSATKPDFKEGDEFTASGIFTPVETLSSEYMYETVAKGILSVTMIENVDVKKPLIPTKPANPGKESATGPCYVGGCSGQICSGQPDMASTCEYREQYVCYKTAKCERQKDTGKCGWTPTAELNACLNRS